MLLSNCVLAATNILMSVCHPSVYYTNMYAMQTPYLWAKSQALLTF